LAQFNQKNLFVKHKFEKNPFFNLDTRPFITPCRFSGLRIFASYDNPNGNADSGENLCALRFLSVLCGEIVGHVK